MHRNLNISNAYPNHTFDKLNNISYENNEFRLSFEGVGSIYWSNLSLTSATVTLSGGKVIQVGIVGSESQWAAGFEPDALVGSAINDVIVGNVANNLIFAGNGNDTLTGGKGDDVLNGGAGNNSYVFSKGDGVDRIIANYENGQVQTIRFTNVSSQEVGYSIEKGALIIHYGNNAQDKIIINDFLVKNIDHFVLQFTDKTIAANAVNSIVGIQYWVDTLVAAASANYDTQMYYAYPTTMPTYLGAADQMGWATATTQLKNVFEYQLGEFERYTNLTFTYTTNLNQANVIALQINDQSVDGSAGYAYYPGSAYSSYITSDVFIDQDYTTDYQTVAHEIGHAVGMPHPHNSNNTNNIPDSWAASENSLNWTMMSYQGPRYPNNNIKDFDISALQALYGVNVNYNSANNVYYFNSSKGVLIGDGAGWDTINAQNSTAAAYIDLNQGAWSYIGQKSAYISSANQMHININTHIEAAVGSNFNDTLIGNMGNNSLDGGAGADIMRGGFGNDVYYVDHINDKVIEFNGQGTDTIYASVSYSLAGTYVETLQLTGVAHLNVTGNSHRNTLIGNDGNNVLNGGGSADIMQGGLGNDTYYVDHVNDKVIEKNGEGTDFIYASVSYSLAGTYVETLQLTGTAHLNATGNSHKNTLIGNSGNNVLNGMGGADIMQGNKGDDTYYVDHANDQVIERANEGNDTIYSSVSYALNGTYVESLYLTGVNANNATGNSQANNLVGNSANNILNGMGGTDILTGGLGSDTAMYKLLTKTDATGGNGSDVWTDFVVGQVGVNANADQINIKDLLVNFNGNGTLVNLENYLTVTSSGSDTNIYIDRDGARSAYTDSLLLTLQNVNTTLDELVRNNQFVV